MISKNTTVVVAPDQVSSELVDESVILNLKTGMYFGLNEVGASVWQLLQQPQTVADLCTAILKDYDVEAAQCESDILALLEELAEAQLIVIKDEVTA
ncbi:MAG: PqqD family protein [Thermosynechococcaceae cyanobacterium]